MRKVYFGLDLGSSRCHGVAVDSKGKVLLDRPIDTNEVNLIKIVEAVQGEVLLHIEACELSRWVYDLLKTKVHQVVVSHPNHNAWIYKDPNKDDRPDAWKLAEMARVDRMHPIFMTDDLDMAAFKRLVQHYEELTSEMVRIKNRIKARFRVEGIIHRGSNVFSEKSWEDFVSQIPSDGIRDAVSDMFTLLFEIKKRWISSKNLLVREAKRFPIINRLNGQVPGVGIIVSSIFVAYVQTPHRFETCRKLWRYSKLGVTNRKSDGKPLGYQRLDRTGNPALKHASHIAARGALNRVADNGFKRYFKESYRRTRNQKHARLNTQRKMLQVMWTMWKTGEEYCDSRV